MHRLEAGDYVLEVEPERGGSIAAFRWRGLPLLRETCGPSIFDTACFPLVPFSNRIANGRFRYGGRLTTLSPNFPGADHPHPLHGFGWLAEWRTLEASAGAIRIAHDHAAGEWPWAYRAEQLFELTGAGLSVRLSVTNRGPGTMPAGLGFHPYFPRDPDTRYRGLHRGEWRTSAEGLPLRLDRREAAIDWWRGAPVGDRAVDTVYCGREGPLEIVWPERRLTLSIEPSAELDHSVVFTPPGADYFCVEPVSHATDAINRAGADGLVALAPGDAVTASMRMRAEAIA